jgi:hypothetical protein
MCGGNAQPAGGGGGSQRSQISLPKAAQNVQKLCQNGLFPTLIDLKNRQKCRFLL